MLTFESLPNEVFIELFEYLTSLEVFFIFEQLNYRFHQLTRTIPLHVNFQYVQKSTFDRFCALLQCSPALKSQVRSLVLSNRDTCGQIDLFLSLFSLSEFPHLRALTFIQIEQQDEAKITATLPSVLTLHTFRLLDAVDKKYAETKILAALPMTNLRRLSLPSLTFTKISSSITHLTVFGCTLHQLVYELFEHTPLLKYLNVQNIYKATSSIDPNELRHSACHLKHLIINNYEYNFDALEIFVQLTPNLVQLTISAFDAICMVDAHRWEQLITSSLRSLETFQFTFGLYCRGQARNDVITKFRQFENEFWCKQHHWYIEYVLDINSAVIYTTPYVSNAYRLTPATEKYPCKSCTNARVFDAVTELTLSCEVMLEKGAYYFSNIRSLTFDSVLTNPKQEHEHVLQMVHIQSLQATVNLHHLTHLDISSYAFIEPAALLKIFTRASQLSSITLNPVLLFMLLNDQALRTPFQTMIRRLNIYKHGDPSFSNTSEVQQLCARFPLLEQLTCCIDQADHLSILLEQGPNLSSIKVYVLQTERSEQIRSWFTNEARKLNVIYRINSFEEYLDSPVFVHSDELNLWIDSSQGIDRPAAR